MKKLVMMTLLTMAALLFAGWSLTPSHDDANTSRTRASKSGLYQVTYAPQVDPVPKRKLHAWTVTVLDANGRPVDGATIGIDGGMPDHGHGLPTQPHLASSLGDGRYVIEGFKFNMGGYWVVDLAVSSASGADAVRFELKL